MHPLDFTHEPYLLFPVHGNAGQQESKALFQHCCSSYSFILLYKSSWESGPEENARIIAIVNALKKAPSEILNNWFFHFHSCQGNWTFLSCGGGKRHPATNLIPWSHLCCILSNPLENHWLRCFALALKKNSHMCWSIY